MIWAATAGVVALGAWMLVEDRPWGSALVVLSIPLVAGAWSLWERLAGKLRKIEALGVRARNGTMGDELGSLLGRPFPMFHPTHPLRTDLEAITSMHASTLDLFFRSEGFDAHPARHVTVDTGNAPLVITALPALPSPPPGAS